MIARWIEMDPADEFYTPYCYVGNDPINKYDPDGMAEKPKENNTSIFDNSLILQNIDFKSFSDLSLSSNQNISMFDTFGKIGGASEFVGIGTEALDMFAHGTSFASGLKFMGYTLSGISIGTDVLKYAFDPSFGHKNYPIENMGMDVTVGLTALGVGMKVGTGYGLAISVGWAVIKDTPAGENLIDMWKTATATTFSPVLYNTGSQSNGCKIDATNIAVSNPMKKSF
jgi:hypothetical protein